MTHLYLAPAVSQPLRYHDESGAVFTFRRSKTGKKGEQEEKRTNIN